MTKKKIAFFGIKYFPSQGGSSRTAESIARELQDKYHITFYCYKNPLADGHLEHVRAVQIPRIPLKEFGVFIYYFLCCIHILFSKKYDIIHVHKTDSAIFIPLLRLRGKVIATSQEAPYLRDKWNIISKGYFRFMEYFFIYFSTIRTSVSQPLANIYQRRYSKPVHYIPNGVTISESKEDVSIDSLLLEYGIREDERFILFAARRIMSTKGLHTMLEAMHNLNYKGKILIAGQHSHAKSYMKTIFKLAEGLDVKFLGYIGDKAILMRLLDRSELFVFPSLTEGLSLMLLEVGVRGTTPILCSDIPENTHVFTPQEALFFKANDSIDFTEKFGWAATNTAIMKEKAVKARIRVINEYSSQVIAKQYDKLYDQILKNTYNNS
ncbi:glycosyltransferase family 4 protein [Muriicola sp. Z0-33]|uniref:glycosyltransferase family 4 protein n=1 Tax=Muriicola sp. Z0-33 TaxID=2816957 RepID=UPI0022378FB4|nr:glycosyltransferase family 4 protein [Muriicola sp. Z0-33]MCW5515665.1 glycosyltransferase family 4 protein [Muriicola sp. Z0-33]